MMDYFLRGQWGAMVLAAMMAANVPAVPPDHVDHSLQKICERGAAGSAAEYCRAQIFIHVENPPQRARWAMRHLECLCQLALQGKSDNAATWEAIAAAESDYRTRYADDPRLPWLAWQLARGDLLRAQQALAKWLATPAAQTEREQALQAVRRLQSQMDLVEKDIKDRLPLSQPRATGASDQAPSRELQELQIDCTALRCEALLVRARCYAADSADHLAALADIDRTATAVLTQSAQDWSARNELIVAQATAGLELGKRQQSLEKLFSILRGEAAEASIQASGSATGGVSQLARLRAGSALVEALCNDGQVDEARKYLELLRKSFDDPEVELCALRVSLAELKKLSGQERTNQLKTAVEQAKTLGQRYGNYWRNRGEALLVATATSSGTSETPGTASGDSSSSTMNELVSVEVRQLLSGGQTAAAIARLKQAVNDSSQSNQFADALTYAVEAAKLMQKEKQWTPAAELLVSLTVEHPELPGAPAAHVLAAWCLAQALNLQSNASELKTQYEDVLQKQLALWPDASETVTAEGYLSNWLTTQKRFDALASMWSHRAAAVGDAAHQQAALSNWLDTVVARLPKNQTLLQSSQLAKEIIDGKLESCRVSATIAALAGALLTTPLTQEEAEELVGLKLPSQQLDQAIDSRNLLGVLMTLVATRRHDAADAHNCVGLVDNNQLSTIVNLAWCRCMVEALDEISATQILNWKPVVELVRMPSDDARLSPMLKMAQLRLNQLSSLRKPGDEALEQIKDWAKQQSSDPNLQLSLAAALAQSGSDSGQAEAIRLLKRVAAGTKKDSEANLRARWLEAQWALGRGDQAAAAEVAKLTMASRSIEPAWWRKRFEKLSEVK